MNRTVASFTNGDGALPPGDDLPLEIAFLREYGVSPLLLQGAARLARGLGVDAATALLASGGVSDTLFYHSLAHFIDAPGLHGLPMLRPRTDPRRAIRDGRVALADGTWLLAPSGTTLRLLLAAARSPDIVPRRIAVTTPARLEALVLRRSGGPLARRASLALPALAPCLSALKAARPATAAAACAMVGGAMIGHGASPPVFWWVVGVIFMAGLILRWAACATGLPREALDRPRAPSADALPFYTVLVPLRCEANMAGDIVHHLAALDYPAAKLEILLLVEEGDAQTRSAFIAAPRPATMRVVAVPPGAPLTKPRALNLGLTLARGALITVYDAEDRPDPDQLRKAAARFAAAKPDLACLQAALAIRDADGGLLPRLFALEYAVLFDLYNVGLSRLRLPIALGGTSNHFRGMG